MSEDQVLTCIACRETFDSFEAQREHYRGDYHRFNLKRKVLNLPPVSENLFQKKVKELKEKESTKEVFSGYCQFCRKKFSNPKTYNAHINSKKHLEREKIAQKNSDVKIEGVTSSITKEPINQASKKEDRVEAQTEEEYMDEKIKNAYRFQETECLICSKISDSFEENIEHMAQAHGLYIPDLEYIIDIEGLLSYLGEKVGTGNACLYCNKVFRTCHAVQNHMKSSNHGKLNFEDQMEEYEDFYDYSSTWEELGEDFDPDEPISEEQQLQIIMKTGKGVVDVGEDGYRLILANGKSLGHRDLVVYYKQNYNRIMNRDPNESKTRVINRYKSLGWKTELTKKEKRARRKQATQFYKEQMQVSVKNNKLQKFFREQVLY